MRMQDSIVCVYLLGKLLFNWVSVGGDEIIVFFSYYLYTVCSLIVFMMCKGKYFSVVRDDNAFIIQPTWLTY